MDRLAINVTGFAALLGPMLMLASTVVHIAADEELNNGQAGGIIQVWAFIDLGIAIIGFARMGSHRPPPPPT